MNKALRTRYASSDRMFWPLTSSWSPVGNTRLLLRKQTSGRWIIILNIGNEFNLKDKSLPEADTTSQPPCVVFFSLHLLTCSSLVFHLRTQQPNLLLRGATGLLLIQMLVLNQEFLLNHRLFLLPGGYIPTLETKQRECWKSCYSRLNHWFSLLNDQSITSRHSVIIFLESHACF